MQLNLKLAVILYYYVFIWAVKNFYLYKDTILEGYKNKRNILQNMKFIIKKFNLKTFL